MQEYINNQYIVNINQYIINKIRFLLIRIFSQVLFNASLGTVINMYYYREKCVCTQNIIISYALFFIHIH